MPGYRSRRSGQRKFHDARSRRSDLESACASFSSCDAVRTNFTLGSMREPNQIRLVTQQGAMVGQLAREALEVDLVQDRQSVNRIGRLQREAAPWSKPGGFPRLVGAEPFGFGRDLNLPGVGSGAWRREPRERRACGRPGGCARRLPNGCAAGQPPNSKLRRRLDEFAASGLPEAALRGLVGSARTRSCRTALRCGSRSRAGAAAAPPTPCACACAAR